MLLELRDHLRRDGPLSVQELEQRIAMPAAVVSDMLERWIAKGCVRRCSFDGCTGCSKQGGCSPNGVCPDLYAWVEPGAQAQPPA